MRAVIQRVSRATVRVGSETKSEIGEGLLVLLGVERDDGPEDVAYMAQKIPHLRVFADERDRMNRSAAERNLPVLVVSQFTLVGDVRRGRRPDFTAAEEPARAEALVNECCDQIRRDTSLKVENGVFGARMDVELVNAGPVTILLDSRRRI